MPPTPFPLRRLLLACVIAALACMPLSTARREPAHAGQAEPSAAPPTGATARRSPQTDVHFHFWIGAFAFEIARGGLLGMALRFEGLR